MRCKYREEGRHTDFISLEGSGGADIEGGASFTVTCVSNLSTHC